MDAKIINLKPSLGVTSQIGQNDEEYVAKVKSTATITLLNGGNTTRIWGPSYNLRGVVLTISPALHAGRLRFYPVDGGNHQKGRRKNKTKQNIALVAIAVFQRGCKGLQSNHQNCVCVRARKNDGHVYQS